MNSKTATLYIVSTPIGNLADMTPRAVDTLKQVDLILAEDTRHASILLRHFDIPTPVWSCHEHNERNQLPAVLERLTLGQSIALISDAGTPLISDPGFAIVRAAREQGIAVSPVPGACALVAALSAAGLPTDRFCFGGFVPAKSGPRQRLYEQIRDQTQTIVVYESSHRIVASLNALREAAGVSRRVVVARELTKKFEQFYHGVIDQVVQSISADPNSQKGEFVIMVEGRQEQSDSLVEARRLLSLLVEEMSVRSASSIAARWFGGNRNDYYRLALELAGNDDK